MVDAVVVRTRYGRDRRTARTGRRVVAAAAGVIAFLATACTPPATPPPPIISLGTPNVIGDGHSLTGTSAPSGQLSVFNSLAGNLVPGDTNGAEDLFLRDRSTSTTTRVAEHSGTAPTISNNSRYVGFRTGTSFAVFDRTTSATTIWSDLPGIPSAGSPIVTDDGSTAIYGVRSSFGLFGTACRARDMTTGTITDCPAYGEYNGTRVFLGTSANARFVVYSVLDVNGSSNSGWVVWDVRASTVNPVGPGFTPSFLAVGVSNDGRYVTSLGVDPISGSPVPQRYDRVTAATVDLPVSPDASAVATSISPNGNYVAFGTAATNLAGGDTNGLYDIYVWNVTTGQIRLASATPSGTTVAVASSQCGAVPGQTLDDGSTCVQTEGALVAADTNGLSDLYRR